MKRVSIVMCSLSAVLLGAAVMAQAPAGDVDARIAAARAAAGQDFRNTFINLCLPGGGRGGARGATPADAAGRGAAAGAAVRGAAVGGAGQAAAGRGAGGQTPDRYNWYAPPFRVFATSTGSARASIRPGRCRRAPASSSSTRTSPGPPSRRSLRA